MGLRQLERRTPLSNPMKATSTRFEIKALPQASQASVYAPIRVDQIFHEARNLSSNILIPGTKSSQNLPFDKSERAARTISWPAYTASNNLKKTTFPVTLGDVLISVAPSVRKLWLTKRLTQYAFGSTVHVYMSTWYHAYPLTLYEVALLLTCLQ